MVNGPAAHVIAVCRSSDHSFSKSRSDEILLEEGIGIAGDAHAGRTVQHLSRIRIDPSQPNLRQVHLIHSELFDELAEDGFSLSPGDLGENITTRGLDLLGLGRDTILAIGEKARVRVTGLRNPCAQIEAYAPGLLAKVARRTPDGIVRKAGIMGVVERSGPVRSGDAISVFDSPLAHIPLERV